MKRKNIKNDKVLRAITIGLATMIAATSAPISVLADDGEPEESRSESSAPTEEKTEESSSENHEHENVDHSNDSQETQEIGNQESVAEQVYETSYPETPTDANPGVVAPIETAIEEVNDLTPVVSAFGTQENTETYTLIDAQGVQEITTLLTNESENQNEQGALQLAVAAGTNLQGAVADLGQAYDCASLAEAATQSAEKKVNDEKKLEKVSNEAAAFDEEKEPTTANAQSAINNAKVANNEGATKEEAYAAADQAIKDLANAEDGLTKAEYHYEQAEQAYNYVAADVQKARAERESAQRNLADANQKLEAAKENSVESQKRLEEAQRKLNQINDKIEKLNGIKDQYYKLMVYYYNDTSTGTKAVYKDDGILNVEESGKNAVETATGSASEDTFKLGRELMSQLIDYKLSANENVVPGSIKIGTEGKAKDTSKGVLNRVEGKNDTVTVKKDGSILFYDYSSGNGGKCHAVKVTYKVYKKDENGNLIKGENGEPVTEEKTEYYNYVLKSKNDSVANKDFENGPIYLAQEDITKPATDTSRVIRDKDENNFDSWTKLTKVLSDFEKVQNEYKEAADAVTKANDLVGGLRGQIAELSASKTVSDKEIAELEDELAKAKEDLDQAEKDKKVLEDKVKEARKAVAAIDLSRFVDADDDDDDDDDDTTDDDDDTTGGDETPGAGGGVVFDPSTGTFSAPAYGFGSTILPGFTGGPATGVLGVRTDGGTEADEGGVADSRTNVAPRANFSTVNKVLGSRQNKDNSQLAKKIKDNEIPLAEIPNMDDEVTMNWMWLLIIFLLGATGKKMYDEYKKKKEAEEAAKINK